MPESKITSFTADALSAYEENPSETQNVTAFSACAGTNAAQITSAVIIDTILFYILYIDA